MKDIPIFTTPAGTASLILREIPYKRTAYILVRSVLPGGMGETLSECRAFCVQAGAERVLASADGPLDLPHDHDMLELARPKSGLPAPEPPVPLVPVTRENAPDYQAIYNRLFTQIPGAATCHGAELARALSSGGALLAVSGGNFAGIGETEGSELRAVGVLPEYRGLGRRLTLTLLDRLEGPDLLLRVSSVNERALRLYERLGFQRRGVLSRWYLVTG